MSTSFSTCSLCEANCGIQIEHENGRITRIQGDEQDPMSRGYICPKAVALQDLHTDPDRLVKPLRRMPSGSFEEASWENAFDEIGARIHQIQSEHGRDAVALFAGNPSAHSFSAALYGVLFAQVLNTKNLYSSNSADALPRLLASFSLYGAQTLIPVPDLDRTHFFLILGANPVVSNGSIMTAPDCARRIKNIRKRGGQVVVIDPRRTETAEIADLHLPIRPSTDAFLLLAMLELIFREHRERLGSLAAFTTGLQKIRKLALDFSPARVAGITGISEEAITGLARSFSSAKSAVCYGRMGTSTQRFGTLSAWLIDVLNAVTGNLDREGGSMFASPAADLTQLASMIGQRGSFGSFRSRVSGLPEFNGELPAAALASEIETRGPGQIRALITHAGNPVLSLPNGPRLARALDTLEFMVSIDIYKNESTRHAHWILPPSFGLERDHYPLLFNAFAVRNSARYAKAVFEKQEGALHDHEILSALASKLLERRGGANALGGLLLKMLSKRFKPADVLRLALMLGPHGPKPWGSRKPRLSIDDLLNQPRGIDLGALVPRLPDVLQTPGKRLDLAPDLLVSDVARLRAELLAAEAPSSDEAGATPLDLLLIGRRQLRGNNSWMHNSLRLVKGPMRCTLLMHPNDAASKGVRHGERVRLYSRVGSVEVVAEISESMMPGVLSLPHGFGHGLSGVSLRVAREHAGVSANDVMDDRLMDGLSGCVHFNGVAVGVQPIGASLSVDGPALST